MKVTTTSRKKVDLWDSEPINVILDGCPSYCYKFRQSGHLQKNCEKKNNNTVDIWKEESEIEEEIEKWKNEMEREKEEENNKEVKEVKE